MQVITYRDFYRPPSMIGRHRGFGRGWLSGTVSNGDMKNLMLELLTAKIAEQEVPPSTDGTCDA